MSSIERQFEDLISRREIEDALISPPVNPEVGERNARKVMQARLAAGWQRPD